jgi:positive regulator of sigma E activity
MDLNKYRIKSFIGLAIFIIGMVLAFVGMKGLIIHLTGLLLAVMGWLVFSNYHTKIAMHKLKEITKEYVDSVKK